jgi:hypothetical protein
MRGTDLHQSLERKPTVVVAIVIQYSLMEAESRTIDYLVDASLV